MRVPRACNRVKEAMIWIRRDITDEDSQDSSGIRKQYIGVEFQIRLSAVTNEYEFTLGEVGEDLVKRAFLPLGHRLKYTLQHASILLQVERAFWKTSRIEEACQYGVELPWRVGYVMKLDAHVCQSLIPFLDTLNSQISKFPDEGVAEYLSGTRTYGGVLDRIVYIANHAHACGICDLHFFRG